MQAANLCQLRSSIIINLNIGTTIKDAIDKLDRMLKVLTINNIKDCYIHYHRALSRMMLPFTKDVFQFNFTKAIDSITIFAKFIGLPLP
ncbi:hypothetical protein [Synechocystis sp. PCC 7509]|uniref:hypothetical protein n=1 Tax=Synechocystis sp. PCC 7509 TaxID=927677 RepID=UPI00048B4840|nr:hypothetical protein [Synechocystis sp. PCC 7509]